jgi:hypothetical protein
MANIDRTAYPRFPRVIPTQDLLRHYTPDADEVAWVAGSAYGRNAQLSLMVLLKTFQQLHYFPDLDAVPGVIVDHVRTVMNLGPKVVASYQQPRTLCRHCAAVRTYLDIHRYYGKEAQRIAVRAAYEAAEVMDQRIDVINAALRN